MSVQAEATSRDYLLSIALGPVQEFISAGRKTRDLFAGSDLLSELSRAAAQAVAGQNGVGGLKVDVIFPGPETLPEGSGIAVANKILAHAHGTLQQVETLAEQARDRVQEVLKQRWDDALATITFDKAKDALDLVTASAQVKDFLEWYAAWTPFDPNSAEGADSYKERRQRVERLLGGRKALRDFQPAHGVAGRPKSSLDPARESIIEPAALANREDHDGHPSAWKRRQDEIDAVRRTLRLKGAEQLDAVSFIKRLEPTRFVSVSRVAIDPFIRLASHDEHEALLARVKDTASHLIATDLAEEFPARDDLTHFAAFPYDCQLFYAPRVPDSQRDEPHWLLDREQNPPLLGKEMDAAVSFINQVHDLIDDLAAGPPPTYFAVLKADGDRMGRAIERLGTIPAHQDFSNQLGQFAGAARAIVTRHFGALVYSGGDDVLAFLPLDTALPCADALRREFESIMTAALQQIPLLAGETREDALPTLSVGVAIGHYSDHLQALLERADEAEKAAKRSGRNALAVSFTAHSGGGDTRTVVHGWGSDPVRTHWRQAVWLHLEEAFPDKGAYELDGLRREFQAFAERRPDDAAAMQAVLPSEMSRILTRKREGRGQTLDSMVTEPLMRRLDQADRQGQKQPLKRLGALVDELIIARRIAPVVRMGGEEGQRLWLAQDDANSASVNDGNA